MLSSLSRLQSSSMAVSSLTLAPFRTMYVRVTSTPNVAMQRLNEKLSEEGLERLMKARKTYMKPSLVRQRNESDAKYFKAKRERVKLVEELVLQKKYFPW